MEERCVICGRIIPEGRQVCPVCESGKTPAKEQEKDKASSRESGFLHIKKG